MMTTYYIILLHLVEYFSRFIHTAACISISSLFLWLNTILLFKYTTFCLFIHLWMNTGFLSLLGYCNKHGDANISFEILLLILLVIYPKMEFLDHILRLWFLQWPCMDVRVGLWRKLSTEEFMLLNCGVGEDSWESLGLQGDPTSSF